MLPIQYTLHITDDVESVVKNGRVDFTFRWIYEAPSVEKNCNKL